MSAPMPVPPDESGPHGLESWMYGAIGIFVVVLAVIGLATYSGNKRTEEATAKAQQLSQELAWLVRRCRRLLWLNPLLRFDAYQPVARGAAVLHRYAHGMLAVHNLARLQDLARSLAAVMKT